MVTDYRDDYFEWLYDLACGGFDRSRLDKYSYTKLLTQLHSYEFKYLIRRDKNRAEDGIGLRRRYFLINCYDEHDYDLIMHELSGPCSVLEMMVALAIRCEEDTMDDPSIGDRTKQWFWNMLKSLGLNSMVNSKYDERYVEEVIIRFLNREYSPDGKGGLFTIKNSDVDLRDVEIWYQMCWYLNTIV